MLLIFLPFKKNQIRLLQHVFYLHAAWPRRQRWRLSNGYVSRQQFAQCWWLKVRRPLRTPNETFFDCRFFFCSLQLCGARTVEQRARFTGFVNIVRLRYDRMSSQRHHSSQCVDSVSVRWHIVDKLHRIFGSKLSKEWKLVRSEQRAVVYLYLCICFFFDKINK